MRKSCSVFPAGVAILLMAAMFAACGSTQTVISTGSASGGDDDAAADGDGVFTGSDGDVDGEGTTTGSEQETDDESGTGGEDGDEEADTEAVIVPEPGFNAECEEMRTKLAEWRSTPPAHLTDLNTGSPRFNPGGDSGGPILIEGDAHATAGTGVEHYVFRGTVIVAGSAIFEADGAELEWSPPVNLPLLEKPVLAVLEKGTVDWNLTRIHTPPGRILVCDEGRIRIKGGEFVEARLRLAAGDAGFLYLEATRATALDVETANHSTLALTDMLDAIIRVRQVFSPGWHVVITVPPVGMTVEAVVDTASAGVGYRMDVRNSKVSAWRLAPMEETEVVIRDAYHAVDGETRFDDVDGANGLEIDLPLNNDSVLTGLQAEKCLDDFDPGLTDRSLKVERSCVRAWNLEPGSAAHVTVNDCELGGLKAGGSGLTEITGGTWTGLNPFLARNAARVKTLDCNLKAAPRAEGHGQIKIAGGIVSDVNQADAPGGAFESGVLIFHEAAGPYVSRAEDAGTVAIQRLGSWTRDGDNLRLLGTSNSWQGPRASLALGYLQVGVLLPSTGEYVFSPQIKVPRFVDAEIAVFDMAGRPAGDYKIVADWNIEGANEDLSSEMPVQWTVDGGTQR